MKLKVIIFISVFTTATFYSQSVTNPRECSSFYPLPNEWYIISGWVKQDIIKVPRYTEDVAIRVIFYEDSGVSTGFELSNETFYVKGEIIDGWQRIIGKFQAPNNDILTHLSIELVNDNTTITCWFDDIRVFPVNGSMKSFVYDEDTQRLMAELDENNYATYYEYDMEGGLIRVKKETERGVYTIQETRSSSAKNN